MKFKKNEIIQYCYFCPFYISYILNYYRILKSQFTVNSFPDAAGETIYMVCVFSWIGGGENICMVFFLGCGRDNIHGLVFFWDGGGGWGGGGETIYMVWYFSGMGGGGRDNIHGLCFSGNGTLTIDSLKLSLILTYSKVHFYV